MAVDVWQVPVAQCRAIAERSLALLDQTERARAARFRRAQDRIRFLVSRVTLRWLLGARLSIDPSALEFNQNPYGKPQLADPLGGLWFNSSHSGEYVVHALSTDGPVGVDVEAVPADLPGPDELRAALAPEEIATILAIPGHSRAFAFALAWARKEAYVKAIGEGLSRDPSRICIQGSQTRRSTVRYDLNAPYVTGDWVLADLVFDRQHAGCVAASERGDPTVRRLHLDAFERSGRFELAARV